jgi:SecD/SecF fusion protein
MSKSLTTRVLICLIPLLIGCFIVGVAYSNYGNPEARGLRFNLGVDLAGGSILVYQVDKSWWDAQPPEKQQEVPQKLVTNLKKRIDPNNLLEVTIRPINTSPPRVEIVLPLQITQRAGADSKDQKQGQAKIDEIKALISQVGRLEFRLLADMRPVQGVSDQDAIRACKEFLDSLPPIQDKDVTPPVAPEYREGYEWIALSTDELSYVTSRGPLPEGFSMQGDNAYYHASKVNRSFVLTKRPPPEETVTGDDLFSVRADMGGRGGTKYVVKFSLRSLAAEKFWELTKAVGHRMAIIFDNQVMSAPTLKSRLRDGGEIEMNSNDPVADKKRVDDLVTILQAGALPATLEQKPVSELTMGAGLGEDTIRKGTYALIGSFLAVILFMLVYYRFAGFVASTALFANLVLTVAFMVFVNAAFTLPGLAGLVLMLGMAVDANVLIYERLREERERGAALLLALRNGYDRALPTILDTHFTSIFTAIVLYVVGTDQLKGFGISLTVGLLISLFTSLYMTRVMFDVGFSKGFISDLAFLKLFSKPNINFMGIRQKVFATTVALSILGVVLFLARGEEGLNIDFRGGTAYTIQFKEAQVIETIRAAVNNQPELPQPSVDALYEAAVGRGATNSFTIRTTQQDIEKVRTAVKRVFGDKLLWVEVAPGTLESAANPRFKHQVEISFRNQMLTAPQLEQSVEEWFKSKEIAKPSEFFTLEPVGTNQDGRYEKFKLSFTVPEQLGTAVAPQQLIDFLKEDLHQPVSDRLERFDSQLASETRDRAIAAIGLSWVAITLFLWFRFGSWTFGVSALLCLIHDLMFAMGLIAVGAYLYQWGLGGVLLLDDFKLDLPAIAALLTLVGYSVNDTIVVFDRIRETRGKNAELTPELINNAINGTLSRTVLASLTTWLVVFVLYVFGGEGVHLFSYVMVVGVIIGTYSSIFVASPLLLILKEGKPAERKS